MSEGEEFIFAAGVAIPHLGDPDTALRVLIRVCELNKVNLNGYLYDGCLTGSLSLSEPSVVGLSNKAVMVLHAAADTGTWVWLTYSEKSGAFCDDKESMFIYWRAQWRTLLKNTLT